MDFTLLTIQGRLTEDPTLPRSESGTPICKFTVACNKRIGKDKEKTSFIPTTVFGRQAELCYEYLSKGREVRVVGEIETDSYTDKEGITRKAFALVVWNSGTVEFGSGGRNERETTSDSDETANNQHSQPTRRYSSPGAARRPLVSGNKRPNQRPPRR